MGKTWWWGLAWDVFLRPKPFLVRKAYDFLRSNGLLTGPERESDDPRDALGGTMRAFKLQAVEYSPPPLPLRPAATLRLRPRLMPK